MLLIDDDHVIQQLPRGTANPALRRSVLPRTSVSGRLRLQSQMSDCFDDASGEDGVVVVDQEAE